MIHILATVPELQNYTYNAVQGPLKTGPSMYFQTLSTIAFQSFYALNQLKRVLFFIYIPHFPTFIPFPLLKLFPFLLMSRDPQRLPTSRSNPPALN